MGCSRCRSSSSRPSWPARPSTAVWSTPHCSASGPSSSSPASARPSWCSTVPSAGPAASCQSVRNRLLRKRTPITGLSDRLVFERNRIREVLGERWKAAMLLSSGRLAFDYGTLLATIRATGIKPNPSLVLLAYAVAGLLALIPITPGGLGIVEAGLERAADPRRRPRWRRGGRHAGLPDHLVLVADLRGPLRVSRLPAALRPAGTRFGAARRVAPPARAAPRWPPVECRRGPTRGHNRRSKTRTGHSTWPDGGRVVADQEGYQGAAKGAPKDCERTWGGAGYLARAPLRCDARCTSWRHCRRDVAKAEQGHAEIQPPCMRGHGTQSAPTRCPTGTTTPNSVSSSTGASTPCPVGRPGYPTSSSCSSRTGPSGCCGRTPTPSGT